MLYEVCYRALSSIFVVEATHGRVARGAGPRGLGAGGVLARPPPAGRSPRPGLSSSQPLIDQSILDWPPPLYPLDWLSGGPTR